jgi:hypothetical protein
MITNNRCQPKLQQTRPAPRADWCSPPRAQRATAGAAGSDRAARRRRAPHRGHRVGTRRVRGHRAQVAAPLVPHARVGIPG